MHGTDYPIKDEKGREAISAVAVSVDYHTDQIDDLYRIVQGGVYYVGKTTTPLVDGATTNPIMIDGEPVTVEKAGAIAIYQPEGLQAEEFIWDGEKWNSLGSTNGLGDLAFTNQTSASYTPAGSISVVSTQDQTISVSAVFEGDTVYPDAQVDIPAQAISASLSGKAGTTGHDFGTAHGNHGNPFHHVHRTAFGSFFQRRVQGRHPTEGTFRNWNAGDPLDDLYRIGSSSFHHVHGNRRGHLGFGADEPDLRGRVFLRRKQPAPDGHVHPRRDRHDRELRPVRDRLRRRDNPVRKRDP